MEIVRVMKLGSATQPDQQARLMCQGILKDMLGDLEISLGMSDLSGLTGLYWNYQHLSLATLYFPAVPLILEATNGALDDVVIVRPVESPLEVACGTGNFTVRPGDVAFLSAGQDVQFQLEAGGRLDFAHLPAHALARQRDHLAVLIGRTVSAECLPLQLLCSYAGYLLRHEYQTDMEAQMMIGHFYALIPVLAQNFGKAAPTNRPHLRIDGVKAEIDRRLSDSMLTVGSIAAYEGVTPRAVQKLFHREGTTFSKYLLEQRLALAMAQLLSSPPDARISDIAYGVGFNDLSYFNRTFRRRYGTRPTEVRQFGTSPAA